MLSSAILALVLAIDPARSVAQFSVAHIFVERVTGTVGVLRGSIDLPAPGAIPTSVSATLDARTLKTDDSDRDDSLRGPDWFDTARFPNWTFTSTSVTPSSGGFTVDGALTIHGVTQPEELAVTVSGDAAHPRYHAVCHVDRTVFGIKKNPLDPAIGKIVDVTLDIVTQ